MIMFARSRRRPDEGLAHARNPYSAGCILKIIQNIKTQKESEYSIVTLNRFNENILSTIDDWVLVLDQELKIVKANRSCIGCSNCRMSRCVKSGCRGRWTPLIRKKRLGRPSLRPWGQANVLVVFHDITIQRNQKRQREDILNFMTHELRNPLTNIILNIGRMATQISDGINELYKSNKLIFGKYDLQAAPCVLNGCTPSERPSAMASFLEGLGIGLVPLPANHRSTQRQDLG